MYTYGRMPATIDGIETLNFNAYWQAIKDRINDLRQLPVWATNHAMKLGITVSNLEKKGDRRAIDAMKIEIDKVNDDIAKAWKVKQYIDQYLPQWMAVANQASGSSAPIVPTTSTPVKAPVVAANAVYVEPSATEQFTGWVKSLFGGGVDGVHGDRGLGIAPLIAISAAGIAALAYVVTVGMSLWQDYRFKKDLTQSVIEGKVSSGQMAEILTAARPPETVVEKIAAQAGGNLATIAVLGVLGYAAFWYLTAKKAIS